MIISNEMFETVLISHCGQSKEQHPCVSVVSFPPRIAHRFSEPAIPLGCCTKGLHQSAYPECRAICGPPTMPRLLIAGQSKPRRHCASGGPAGSPHPRDRISASVGSQFHALILARPTHMVFT